MPTLNTERRRSILKFIQRWDLGQPLPIFVESNLVIASVMSDIPGIAGT